MRNPSKLISALFVTLTIPAGCDGVEEDGLVEDDPIEDEDEDEAEDEAVGVHDEVEDLSIPPQLPTEAYVASKLVWKPGVVPVCWLNAAPWNDAHRAWVRDAVANSWSHYAAVDFVGWGACTPQDAGVRIQIDESNPRSAVGTNAKLQSPSMWLNFTFNWWSPSCKNNIEYCVRAIAVHEFGHALGFDHEQNRPDTPAWCAQDTLKSGDTVIGPWDDHSVMNYCSNLWNNGGQLSAGDIAAVTQVYGPRYRWAPLGGGLTSLAVGQNQDGRLEVFTRGTDGGLWHTWQPGWSGWYSLGGQIVGTPAVARNADGRLEVFAQGNDGAMWHNWQNVPNGGWSGWYSLGGWVASPAAAQNQDGRLEVFGVGSDGALWHTWQVVPNGGWSGWASLGGVLTSAPAVAANADGRLEVFVRGTDDALYHTWQVVPNGGWSSWAGLGGSLGGPIAAGRNADGRLEVFVANKDAVPNHKWQVAPGGGWSDWLSLDGGVKGLSVVNNADGRLELFGRGMNDAIYHNWQVVPNGGWSGWASLGGVATSSPVAARNGDGRLEVFVIGTDAGGWHAWQNSPGGSWN